jgi:AraC family transcriptional activator of pobA
MNDVETIPPQPAAVHIPIYALFGEQRWPHELDGLHIEPLGERSRRYNWTVPPHRHPTLIQFLWLEQGNGTLYMDGVEEMLSAPTLLTLPPGVAHGFRWHDDVTGFMLTASPLPLREFVPAENSELLDMVMLFSPDGELADAFCRTFTELFTEFLRSGAGRRAGLAAGVLRLISLIARLEAVAGEGGYLSGEAELVNRFRKLVEVNFWKHLKLEDYCARLGVTTSRLSRACRVAAGKSPLTLIQDRLLLAAKRKLTYTAVNVSEIAFELGFSDPAYFSRFFSRHEGISPIRFRQTHRTAITRESTAARHR